LINKINIAAQERRGRESLNIEIYDLLHAQKFDVKISKGD
jgi:RecB family endonuclease NucS